MLRRLLPTREDAADVLQVTLRYAYVGMRGLRRMNLLGAWLRTIAYNRAMHWQRGRYGEERPGHTSGTPMRSPDPSPRWSSVRTRQRSDSCPDRDAVRLRYVQWFTSAEVGRLQGEIVRTTHRRLRRALDVLGGALSEADDGGLREGTDEVGPTGRGPRDGEPPGPRALLSLNGGGRRLAEKSQPGAARSVRPRRWDACRNTQ